MFKRFQSFDKMLVFTKVSILLVLLQEVQSNLLNILAIFPYQGRSHFLGCEPLLKELSLKGHNLTVISYFPQEKPFPNLYDISLAGKAELYDNWVDVTEPSYLKILGTTIYLVISGTNNCKVLLADENVQSLWKNETKFDVVLVELFNSDCALGLAHKLGAPVVGISTCTLMPYYFSRFGIPNNPSFTPFQLLNGGLKPNLIQRIERTIFTIYFQYVVLFISQTIDQYILKGFFDDIPPLEELGRNIKFMLVNEHFTFFGPPVWPINVKEIGGFHVAKPEPLPEDLEKFINESKYGVIFVSLGTMVKATSTPTEKLEAILGALTKLRQRVIWKWNANNLPANPRNVYISKWLPQNDILAHPKVLAMFYHCGLFGITEAIHHGVPVVAMPIFGDQPRNAAAVEESGLGVQIQVNELNEENLLQKFKTVLDPKFRKNVKRLSKMWHDRPKSAKEEAIFWIEYAARYSNATFKTASVDVPLYQYLCLDVILVFSLLIIAILFFIKNIIYIFHAYRRKNSRTKKIKTLKSMKSKHQ